MHFPHYQVMKKKNKDVFGECYVRDDQGQISLKDVAKKKACRVHYNHLLNVEFPWSLEDLCLSYRRPSNFITLNTVAEAVCKMKQCKGPCSSGIVAEMIKALGKLASLTCLAS